MKSPCQISISDFKAALPVPRNPWNHVGMPVPNLSNHRDPRESDIPLHRDHSRLGLLADF